MDNYNVTVVSGGLSTPSSTQMLSESLSKAVAEEFANQGMNAQVKTIELRKYATDIAHNMVTRFASPALSSAIKHVMDADALIVVSPVFSGSYSGLFKSFFDVIEMEALAGKPVIIAATGGSIRHSLMLDHTMRPLFAYLKTQVMPTSIYASPENWAIATGESSLENRIHRASKELANQFVNVERQR